MKRFRPGFLLVAFLFLEHSARIFAAAGDLYEPDFGSGRILRFTPTGAESVFAAGLINPSGLAFDAASNLLAADYGTGQISKFTPTGSKTIFASGLNKPFGLAFDSQGNLFVADSGSNTIFKFTAAGVRTTFAIGLNIPADLAFDRSGNLYEADFGSGHIFKFTPAGLKSTFAAGLGSPDGLTVDANGNVFTGDTTTHVVTKITLAGNQSSFVAGLSQPTGVAFDVNANVFIADNSAGTIIKVTAAGTRSTFASGLKNPQYLIFEPATSVSQNISTRLNVQTGDNVLIGGFIISGTASKAVIIRGLGPSLSSSGITNPLQDPVLELHNANSIIATNDDWQSAANSGQIPVSLRPSDPRESAILTTLAPGSYSVILSGEGATSGVGLVELYDLDAVAVARLANISTRGLVGTLNDVMIGGFILGEGNGSAEVLVRALGPSLAQSGVANPLADPTLELHDANGVTIATDDNWKDTQEAAIEATSLAPGNDLEAAILAVLPSGPYTAVVAGKAGGSGVALVEVYNLQ